VARAARLPLPQITLAALMGAALVLFLHHGRGFSFFGDEWSFIIERRTGSVDDFLRPHNEHMSAVPVAIFKVMFRAFGLDDYRPYQVVLLGLHLLASGLVFVLARRRIGDWGALVATSFLLFFGQGWEDLLWAFQIGFLMSLVGFLGALVAIERRDRAGDVAAALLLLVALCSSGIGIPLLVVAGVELAWREEDRTRLWVAWAPALVYGLWYLGYGKSAVKLSNLPDAPEYAATTIAGTVGPLVGLGLDFGRPLAVLGAALLVWRLARPGVPTPRAAALVAGLVCFVGVLGLSRADVAAAAPPDASRYVYPCAFLVVLIAVELARGVRISRTALVLLAAVALTAAVSNVTALRLQGDTRRAQIADVQARMGAVLIARDSIDPGFVIDLAPHGPPIHAAQLIGAIDQLGSPVFSAAQLPARSEEARGLADGTLVAAERIAPAPAPAGSCTPFARAAPGTPADLEVPPGGVRVVPARAAPVEVRLRRYAVAFGADPTFTLTGRATIAMPRDRAPQPWHIQVSSSAAVTLCALG
jgi:hypothetical protein